MIKYPQYWLFGREMDLFHWALVMRKSFPYHDMQLRVYEYLSLYVPNYFEKTSSILDMFRDSDDTCLKLNPFIIEENAFECCCWSYNYMEIASRMLHQLLIFLSGHNDCIAFTSRRIIMQLLYAIKYVALYVLNRFGKT